MLELITGGELFDKIVAEGKFDEAKARFYFRQLIKGMKYCHSQGARKGVGWVGWRRGMRAWRCVFVGGCGCAKRPFGTLAGHR